MAKQKIAVVPIPHSESRNFIQDDHEMCMGTHRDFHKTYEFKVYFCRYVYFGRGGVFVFNFHFLVIRIFPCHVRMQLQQ